MDYSKSDWKLFRDRIGDWQESYIEKLNHQYIDLLNGDGLASDKFWGLNRRIREDRKVWVFRWNFVNRICRIRWSICCMRKLSRKMT